MLCDTLTGEICTNIPPQLRDMTMDQDATKVQLGETLTFTEVTDRNIGDPKAATLESHHLAFPYTERSLLVFPDLNTGRQAQLGQNCIQMSEK